MKQRAYTIRTLECESVDDLDSKQALLVDKAKEAARRAYAPYSSYLVGAALELDNGEIITGNNQENAAYPSGLCAERVAIFYAGARHPEAAVTRIAIAAMQDGQFQENPVPPCGACRQVLHEAEVRGQKDMEIILFGSQSIVLMRSATDLLPLPFVLRK